MLKTKRISYLSSLVTCVLILFSCLGKMASADTLQAQASAPAQGHEKAKKAVVLLVSLAPSANPHGLAGLFHDYAKYPEKLAATFISGFANSDFEIQIVQNANRYDLYQALHSPDNVGVFWLSHEAPVVGKANSIVATSSSLLDHNLADVKPVFEEINPAIRWVSLVACDSNLVVNWLKGQGLHEDKFQMQGFDQEIEADVGLKKAINLALPLSLNSVPSFQDTHSPFIVI
jgi:hypothetical protein